MSKKRIRFIINPKSGTGNKRHLPELIKASLDSSLFETEITFTEGPKHGTLLSREAAEKNWDAVIAVGGDGSANEVAKGLIGTDTALGILATGSGNGMARHLGIPMDP